MIVNTCLFVSLVFFLAGHFVWETNFMLSNVCLATSAIIFAVILIKNRDKKDEEKTE